ncbi:MAG: glycosidase, partial [Calditrichaeota bacterium]
MLGLALFMFLAPPTLQAKNAKVEIVQDASGFALMVNGEKFMINGMNWDYYPIGTNYTYSLWKQPEDIIRAALDSEMSLLKNMGVNVIRVYTGIPPKWVRYIYENYGIYTILNHSFGRYGLTLDGVWYPHTDYADPRVRKLLLSEVKQMVDEFKDTPGLLMYLLGNENNYGLFWEGAETSDIPVEQRKSTQHAYPMYQLFNDAALSMKELDTSHPVAMCNGDLLFIEIIAQKCKDIDIFGTNMYRGKSFGDAFQRVKELLNKPLLFTEFGADAYNALENREDQKSQAEYLVSNWKEIYENAYGLGKTGIAIGGCTFQFSDGWWKTGQTKNLDIHDVTASWSNGGYQYDYREGENNMNEEWFGICAKGPTNLKGLYELYPRAAYYALKEVHKINPYQRGLTLNQLEARFAAINLMDALMKARSDKAALTLEKTGKVRLSGLRAELYTYNTGGTRVSTPEDPIEGSNSYPNAQGFDKLQSFYTQFEAQPTEGLVGSISLNILGAVPGNPIDEIFYENRGRPQTVRTRDGDLKLNSLNRVSVYKASMSWNHPYFNLDGFYRTGHYHWGYEGDFFGLYPEANYGPNIDLYNATAPFGFEMEGKRQLKGLKVAFGPELWWGANPAVLVKYSRAIGKFQVTGIYHEDIDQQGQAVSSFAIPSRPTRRATLHIKTDVKGLGVEVGGIWAGEPRIGEKFQIADGSPGNYTIYQDRITSDDTWGGKIKLTYSFGPVNWYAQAAAMGLVADGGPDLTQTFTGWRLKDSGSGNQYNFLSGFTYLIGDLQIAPNFLWQQPVVGPVPGDVPPPGRPRNILDDPFAVRANREMTAAELLLTYDPTPGTWFYSWDNDVMEDAKFAANAGFVYRKQPTTVDAAPYVAKDGRTIFIHTGGTPPRDLWEAHARIVSKVNPRLGLIANLYGGEGESIGSDPRLIHRYGGDLRVLWGQFKLMSIIKINDWGPYDYHRDFNLTFPLQLMVDFSTTIGTPDWFDAPTTRLGVRYT